MPSSWPALVSPEAFFWLVCFPLSQYQPMLTNIVPGGRDLFRLGEPQARIFMILRDVVAATFSFFTCSSLYVSQMVRVVLTGFL